MQCSKCQRDFPTELLEFPLVAGGKRIECCPICALNLRNAQTGLPKETKFSGEIASSFYSQAVTHVKTTNQKTDGIY